MTLEVSDRPATNGDFDFIWSLYAGSVEPVLSKLIRWHDAEQRARFREITDLGTVRLAVVQENPIAWFALAETEITLDLEQLFILEKYRRKGLGRGIVDWARAQAEDKSLTFRLPTLDEPSALAFASSLGLSGNRLDQTTIIYS